jgi:hypothetical protein
MTLDMLLPLDAKLDAAQEQSEADPAAGDKVQPGQFAKQKRDQQERGADDRYIRRNGGVCSNRAERSDQD